MAFLLGKTTVDTEDGQKMISLVHQSCPALLLPEHQPSRDRREKLDCETPRRRASLSPGAGRRRQIRGRPRGLPSPSNGARRLAHRPAHLPRSSGAKEPGAEGALEDQIHRLGKLTEL
jgi:hypothetical protein